MTDRRHPMQYLAATLAVVVGMTGCGDGAPAPGTNTTSTTAGTASPDDDAAATGPASFIIHLVRFDAPMVVIANVGDESGSLAAHWLCQNLAYVEIPDFELDPGESVAISLGGAEFLPPPGALSVSVAHGIGPMDPTGGEIALFSRPSFDVPDAIVSYVEWGSPNHPRSPTATEAGIWAEGGFVATTESSSLIELPDPGDPAPSNWMTSP